jgi:hypothetical protein
LIRRALLKQWPALTRFYGLFPWDVDRLTADELAQYVTQMADYQREVRRQEARAQRGRG